MTAELIVTLATYIAKKESERAFEERLVGKLAEQCDVLTARLAQVINEAVREQDLRNAQALVEAVQREMDFFLATRSSTDRLEHASQSISEAYSILKSLGFMGLDAFMGAASVYLAILDARAKYLHEPRERQNQRRVRQETHDHWSATRKEFKSEVKNCFSRVDVQEYRKDRTESTGEGGIDVSYFSISGYYDIWDSLRQLARRSEYPTFDKPLDGLVDAENGTLEMLQQFWWRRVASEPERRYRRYTDEEEDILRRKLDAWRIEDIDRARKKLWGHIFKDASKALDLLLTET